MNRLIEIENQKSKKQMKALVNFLEEQDAAQVSGNPLRAAAALIIATLVIASAIYILCA